jgi:mannonate dehydratase
MNRFDRRTFVGLSGMGAATACAGVASSVTSAAADIRKPVYMKLGCQSGPTSDAHFAYLARYGIANIIANPIQADPSRLYGTVDEFEALLSRVGSCRMPDEA